MTTTLTDSTRGTAVMTVLTAAVGIPLLLALTFAGIVTTGPFGLAVPLLVGAAVWLYRSVVRSTRSDETRAVAREVGAAVLALGFGFGTWVGALVIGILIGVLPFLMSNRPYPYEGVWMLGSTLAALASVPAFWWLLRRWVDPSLRSR